MKQNSKNPEKTSRLFMGVFLLGIFILSVLELYKYDGFIEKYLFVKLDYLYILYIVIWFADLFWQKDVGVRRSKIVAGFLFCLLSITVILSIILNYLEFKNYTNYVLAHFHIALSVFPKIIIFEGLLFILFSLKPKIKDYLKVLKKDIFLNPAKTILFCTLIIFLSYYMVSNTLSVLNYFRSNLFTIALRPKASYEEKMEIKLGNYYVFMNFIKNKTPENSVIVTPPYNDPWLFFSNFALARYFLYPRELVIYDRNLFSGDNSLCAVKKCYVMAIKYTNPDNIWPVDDFPGKRFYYFNKDNWELVGEKTGYYADKEDANLKTWGIIEQ